MFKGSESQGFKAFIEDRSTKVLNNAPDEGLKDIFWFSGLGV